MAIWQGSWRSLVVAIAGAVMATFVWSAPVDASPVAHKPSTRDAPARVQDVSESTAGRIVFTRSLDTSYYTYSISSAAADGSDVERLTRREYFQTPRWSPSGRRIAYFHDKYVWLMRADGTHKHRVFRAGNMDAWGPNGGRLLVDRPGGDTFGVFSLKNNAVRWFPYRKMGFPGGVGAAWDWSWRTNRIVFTGWRDFNGNEIDLYTVSPDFTGLKQVTHTPRVNELGARWAPEGQRRLAYTASIYRAPQCDDRLQVLRLADKCRTKLGCNGAASNAAWSPDGRQLLFARRTADSRLGAQDIVRHDLRSGRETVVIRHTRAFRYPDQPDWRPPRRGD